MTKTTIANHYFKDRFDGSNFMSGLPLPTIATDSHPHVLQDTTFVRCAFNVPWNEVQVTNCEFIDCSGVPTAILKANGSLPWYHNLQ